jgi:hypothetical protein
MPLPKPKKLTRKTLPPGLAQGDFIYMGRPAKDQGDFGDEVGIADMACVDQFGNKNASKHYHGGVVKSTDGRWWCYFEWGRVKSGNSWNGVWTGNSADFQFWECADEAEARECFARQMKSKNLARLEERDIAGVTVWAAKVDKHGKAKDGYLVGDRATRDKGLPDAYKIKTGIEEVEAKKVSRGEARAAKARANRSAGRRSTSSSSGNHQSQVVKLAKDLVGGTQTYTRSMTEASGVTPTLGAIEQVRDTLVPAAMARIKACADANNEQVNDRDLVDISRMVAGLVPRPIPHSGQTAEEAILSSGNILALQADLDAFEAALLNVDFSVEAKTTTFDPDAALNAQLRWIDPKGDGGRWVHATFAKMTKRRHANVGRVRVLNVFEIKRPDRDARFVAKVQHLATRGRTAPHRAELQPARRPDVADIGDHYKAANVALLVHGTRGVNVGPIMQTDLRLPKSLRGVRITGAAFGHGCYWADDFGKSLQYVGGRASVYGTGGGIKGRGAFMFLGDVALGRPHMAKSAWTISDKVPDGGDSVYATNRFCRSLQNNEYVVFTGNQHRLRYLVEVSW